MRTYKVTATGQRPHTLTIHAADPCHALDLAAFILTRDGHPFVALEATLTDGASS